MSMIFKNRTLVFLFVISYLMIISCKQKNTTTLENNHPKIPVLETGMGQSMPIEWIDKDTHHKIEKITPNLNNSRSFYFHNTPFLPGENKNENLMVFYGETDNGKQLFSVNLNTGIVDQITNNQSDKKGEIIGAKTRRAYYMVKDSVFFTHIDTHETKFVYKFPDNVIGSVTTLNADENILGGVLITKEEQEIFNKNPKKSSYFNSIYEAKLKRTLITINIENGEMAEVFSENAWLNHVQFSPTDPDLLMYCHEGPWHKVDRIWNINIKTKENQLIHKRSVDREIAGHEFFSPDGQTIWYDLQIPRGETFYLAGKNLNDGSVKRYALKRDEWSIHYNISPDLKTFAGDGGDEGQVAQAKNGRWIYHFQIKGDSLVSEKLVNMKNHNYDLEPNVHFSPDGKKIIFRANFEGTTQIYAVEIQKYH